MRYPFFTALLLSFSVHVFAGYAWVASHSTRMLDSAAPIEISYIPAEKKKDNTVKPLFKEPVKFKPGNSGESKEKPKKTTSKPKIQTREALTSAPLSRPRSAVDFMADPQKEKAFNDYFDRLKEKIQLNLRRQYHSAQDSAGTITLFFVLNPDGSLVKVNIVNNESRGGDHLRVIAENSLRRAAPFGGFPRELGNVAVAFHLKIYFDEIG